MVSRCRPCDSLDRNTFAPTMAAPDLSSTVPRSEVVPDCAKASVPPKTRQKTIAAIKLRRMEAQNMDSSFTLINSRLYEIRSVGRPRTLELLPQIHPARAGSRYPSLRDPVSDPHQTYPDG